MRLSLYGLLGHEFFEFRVAPDEGFYVGTTWHDFPMLTAGFLQSGPNDGRRHAFTAELSGDVSVVEVDPIPVERIGHIRWDAVDLRFKALPFGIVLDLDFRHATPT